jgi:hypothetical protein
LDFLSPDLGFPVSRPAISWVQTLDFPAKKAVSQTQDCDTVVLGDFFTNKVAKMSLQLLAHRLMKQNNSPTAPTGYPFWGKSKRRSVTSQPVRVVSLRAIPREYL